jgi:glycosyltransferase involved in cell wall biosynthesis
LIVSGDRVLARGLPANELRAARMQTHARIHRLSKVVISIHRGVKPMLFVRYADAARLVLAPLAMLLRRVLWMRERLTRFDASAFRDFIWRALFARTLRQEDFDEVTSRRFRIGRVPIGALHVCALLTRRIGLPLFARLDTREFDVLIAETPFPANVDRRTQLVVRYHDAIPLLMPHTITDRHIHQACHYNALRENVDRGAWFACVSDATRRDLVSLFPEAEARAVTIHNVISDHYFAEDSSPDLVQEILRIRRTSRFKGYRPLTDAVPEGRDGRAPPYLLMVSTVEPRKNHLTLLSAWEQLRSRSHPELKLVLVGELGWDKEHIVSRFLPWLNRGEAFLLSEVPARDLRVLYRHARATVCPSFGEGFDFSGIEAMACACPVAASDIAVHREIFDDAAAYFNAYSDSDAARAIHALIAEGTDPDRNRLTARGTEVARRYKQDAILPQWQEFLRHAAQPQDAEPYLRKYRSAPSSPP